MPFVSFDTVLSLDYLLNQINCASSASSMMNYAAGAFWVVAVSSYSDIKQNVGCA